MFWGGGEGEEAEVGLVRSHGHAFEQFFHVFLSFFDGTLFGFCLQLFTAEDAFELGGGFSGLGTVGFVDDDGAAAGGEDVGARSFAVLGEFEQFFADMGEFLEGGDDDGDGVFEGDRELGGVFVDFLDDALTMLELVDGVLELLVEDATIGDDDDAIENAFVCVIVEGGEAMGKPADRVAFAASGRVFDEVVLSDAFLLGGLD